MVVILAAAELFGSKINRELEFTHVPSLGELKARAVGVFNDEIAARKRPGVPAGSFNLHYVQLFDPVGKWVELKSASQLRDYCQIYLFQKDSWNKESQGPIPSPTRPSPIPPQFAAPVNVVPAGLCRTSSPVRTVRSIGTPTRSRLGSPYKRPLQSRAASPAVSPKREARLSNSHPKSPVRHHSPMAGSATAHRLASPAHSVRASSLAAGISKKSLSPHRAGSSASVHLAPVQQSLTHGEKLTLIYTNMLGEKPQVDDDSFRQLFLKTRVNIEPLTITKLFQQADANQV